jgi:hypothetical protein
MELSPGQRKAAFAVIVLALAGLGIFLLSPKSPSAPTHARGAAARPRASTPLPSPPPTVAASTPSASPAGGPVDIYQWLPFSQSELASAAATVRSFAADYATYTWREKGSGYVAPMRGLVTSELAATLERGFDAPGLSQDRSQHHKSATGSGQITALRAFGSASITFLVNVSQRTTGSQGAANLSTKYAVTVTDAASQWQVSDIELATAGNT